MNTVLLRCAAILLTLAAWSAFGHEHDNASPSPGEKLGSVHFRTSCTPEAQKQFEHALTLLHSFYFPETIEAFKGVAQTDPTCAIAYWGIAMSARPNPLVGPFDAGILKRGFDAVQAGQAISAKTQRERDWLAAIAQFYKDYETVDQDTRTRNYELAMAQLSRKYPADVEAKIFHALASNETFDHKSYAPLLRAIKILEPLDRMYPDHPGIPHYLIHSYDFPPLAKYGVRAANKYARVAPAAPHAQHMPSHIYSMLGMWEASIAANQRSIEVANDYAAQKKLDGVYWSIPHSYDFMQYAYLQLGQDTKARALVDQVLAIEKDGRVAILHGNGSGGDPCALLPRTSGLEGRRRAADARSHQVAPGPGGHRVHAWLGRVAYRRRWRSAGRARQPTRAAVQAPGDQPGLLVRADRRPDRGRAGLAREVAGQSD